MAGLDDSHDKYKALRPVQITKSEEKIQSAMKVLESEFINPFGVDIDENKLIHLSSGIAVDDTAADEILRTVEIGQKLRNEFWTDRLETNKVAFHDSIKQTNFQTFSKATKKTVKIGKGGKTKTAEVNRNILSTLIFYEMKTGKLIDYEKALQYPLTPVPLSICHPDGNRRTTGKSKLKDILFKGIPSHNINDNDSKDAVVVDLVALLNTLVGIPETYAGLADKLVKALPKAYSQVDLVADVYHSTSLKGLERKSRGEAARIHIASLQSKVPSDFSRILRNGDNKTRLTELIIEYIEKTTVKVFNIIRCRKIIISTGSKCVSISHAGVVQVPSLISSQEEADTRMMLHCHKIATELPAAKITIRSPSGDTDVVVVLSPFADRIILDDGNGENCRQILLADIDVDEDVVSSLIGFHAFTGNDFVSSFFRKGKETCFKVMERRAKFLSTFTQLGTTWELTEELKRELEHFVCALYGSKLKDVDLVRHEMFKKKMSKEKKIKDMALLAPCRSVLELHCERANYYAAILKRSLVNYMDDPDWSLHGWNSDRTPR